ncbi:MAG: hypothetical protein J5I50_02405 [Chitinophagaceae bacterium]|nr:hypothetical protein [Chitinophagaceae bacterium]
METRVKDYTVYHQMISSRIEEYLDKYFPDIPKNAKLLEMMKEKSIKELVEKEFEEKKKVAPLLDELIKREIEEIDRKYNIDIEAGKTLILDDNEVAAVVFNHIMRGKNPYLIEFIIKYVVRPEIFDLPCSKKDVIEKVRKLDRKKVEAIFSGVYASYYLKFLYNQRDGDGRQKESEAKKIVWKGKKLNDLIYLLWKMKEEGLISLENFGKDLSEILVDEKQKPIKNTLINKYISEFRKMKYPVNASEIDKVISILKKSAG